MTGQVKEDILCRLTELGLVVQDGRLTVEPALVTGGEFLAEPTTFSYRDVHDREGQLELPPGCLALTFCQVPVVVHRSGPPRIEVASSDGATRSIEGLALDGPTSTQVFGRTGAIRRLDVHLGLEPGR
jgi:hypothetical protein